MPSETKAAKQTVIVANWKMFKTIEETVAFIKALKPLVQRGSSKVLLAVPFTSIHAATKEAAGSSIVIGAQNMHHAADGAFTGEVSARMLKNAGAQFVILGHSERRAIFKESNRVVNLKIKRALAEGLTPLVCVGETLEQREQGLTDKVLQQQLKGSLAGMSAEDGLKITLAYEPVWAIGTGKTATPELVQSVHLMCKKWLAGIWGEIVASKISLLYGGSVKPDNVRALMNELDIDGALVGGASLEPQSFTKIVNLGN